MKVRGYLSGLSPNVLPNGVSRYIFLFVFLFSILHNAEAQEKKYTFSFKKQTISSIFQEIESKTPYRFFYNDELVRNSTRLSFHFQDVGIDDLMNDLLAEMSLSYQILDNYLLVITPQKDEGKFLVSGRVLNERGLPMAGVNVFVKGSELGTATGSDGFFEIYLSTNNEKLTFTYIGYMPLEVEAGSDTELILFMEEDLAELEQVIVIGYSELKRSEITGAISSVSTKEISSNKTTNFIEALQGSAAGVDIVKQGGNAGSSLDVTIRGNRSLGDGGASNKPLYVIDGIPYYGNFILNPNDIESIEVLKDASSTAIYGISGANGVVLVSTKKGLSGKSKVSFNTYRGITSKLGELPFADREYYLKKKRDVVRAAENKYNLTDEEVDNIGISLTSYEREYIDHGEDFNWYNNFMKDNGVLQDYNLHISGGSDNLTYATSLSYIDEQSLIEKDNLQRFTLRLSAESNINSFLTAGASFIGGMSNIERGNNFKDDLLKLTPLIPAKDSTGKYITYVTSDRVNPFLRQQATTNIISEINVFSTFFLQFNFTKNIFLRSNVNFQYRDIEDGYAEDIILQADESKAKSEIVTSKELGLVQSNILSFKKHQGKHLFSAQGGFEYQQSISLMSRILANDLLVDGSLWYNPSKSQEAIIIQLENPDDLPYSKEILISYISSFQYSYSDKYILKISGRYDGASQLAKGNRWNFFPSASIAWKMNEENFLADYKSISSLKLRMGYGVVGNRSVPPYSSRAKLNLYPLFMEFGRSDEEVHYGFWPERLENDSLTWERTRSVNMGIDFGFYKHRVHGSIDIYKSFTYNLLQERALPITSGVHNGYDNIGNVTNSGLEVYVNNIILNKQDLYLALGLNFSFNIEKITSLGSGRDEDIGKGWFVGQPVDVYYDYVFDGIWQEDEAELAEIYNSKPGDIRFKEFGNDSVINDQQDKKVIGNPRPKWIGGASLIIRYKNLDFSAYAIARIGQTIVDETIHFWSANGSEAGFAHDYWTPDNPIQTMPGLRPGVNIDTWQDLDRLQYTDGSYVKLKDINLGYTLPDNLFKKVYYSNLRFYVSLKNYIVFSKFFNKGRYDPELAGGITFPIPKMFVFGLNIDF